MKALSIRQPWAHMITNRVDHTATLYAPSGQEIRQERFDFKDVENRTWQTSYRGELLIHASANKGFERLVLIERERSSYASAASLFCQIPHDEKLHLGGIVGVAELWDCVDRGIESPWWEGQWGWRLRLPKALPFSPLKGKLGLFDVQDSDIREETLEALRLWRER
jgi:hypothetical protein